MYSARRTTSQRVPFCRETLQRRSDLQGGRHILQLSWSGKPPEPRFERHMAMEVLIPLNIAPWHRTS